MAGERPSGGGVGVGTGNGGSGDGGRGGGRLAEDELLIGNGFY